MTTTRQAIAATLDAIKQLGVDEPSLPVTIAILHLGHPSDPKYGQVEHMTPEEYRKFVWMNTWPRPKGAQWAEVGERVRG